MRQRKLGSHTPPCHRRMVITTLFSAGGGGGDPTSMAQNDTHVALAILTTQMWAMRQQILGSHTPPCHRCVPVSNVGGGVVLLVEKTFFGPK